MSSFDDEVRAAVASVLPGVVVGPADVLSDDARTVDGRFDDPADAAATLAAGAAALQVTVPYDDRESLTATLQTALEGRIVYFSDLVGDLLGETARIVVLDSTDPLDALRREGTFGSDAGWSNAEVIDHLAGIIEAFGPVVVSGAGTATITGTFVPPLADDVIDDAAADMFGFCSSIADFSAPGDEVEEDDDWDPYDQEDYYVAKLATSLRSGQSFTYWWD